MTRETHDLVIRGGTVVDGTGVPPYVADVAVDAGRITAIGAIDRSGSEEIDAAGLLVTPGWVDVHTHYDGQVSWDDTLTPSSWHGATTVVMGNCGVGFAPVKPERHGWLIDLMEGVEDIPGTALHEGITWDWETYPEYLDAIGRVPRAIDVATQVPHGALRGYVMGDRGGDHREVPTADEIEEMGRLVVEAVEAGALGFSTSRTVNHKSSDGTETPSLSATEAELVGIARAMGEAGSGTLQLVADLYDLESEMALFRKVVEVSGRPLSMTVLQRPEFAHDEYRRIAASIAEANAAGLPITGQVPTRPVGLLMTLQGSVHPLRWSSTYALELASLPVAVQAAALADAEVRARIVAELEETAEANPLFKFQGAFALGTPPTYDPSPDEDLRAIAEREGRSAFDVAVDVLLADSGTGAIYTPVIHYADRTMEATRELLADPLMVPSLGDAGAHCTMICDASMPTFLLTYWARDAAADLRFPVEWAIKRQCADTAAVVGLLDRGVLAPGYRADINLIDHDALELGQPEMVADLPAGGKRLVQRPEGYRATIVAGTTVMRDGVDTGARPGQLVRGARPRPA